MITLESYQETAAAWVSLKKRALVVSPAGSGKTIIAASGLKRVLDASDRPLYIGWIANTIEQVDQANRALASFGIDGVTVACSAAYADWSWCDYLVVDEAHHAPAEGWLTQIQACKGVIWGFTATPETGNRERDALLLSFFDNQVHTVPRSAVKGRVVHGKVILLDTVCPGLKEMIDRLIDVELKNRMRWWKRDEQNRWKAVLRGNPPEAQRIEALSKLKGMESEVWGQVAWQVCVSEGIVNNQLRSETAVYLAKTHRADQVLMLVNQVEHGQGLAGLIPGAVCCYSGMGRKARREALGGFKDGNVKCLVATSLADEGLDLPNANVLVLVSGGRSNAKTEQRTGRVLRAFQEKSHGLIYDFEDTFHPLLAKHSRVRQELYRKLGYEVIRQKPFDSLKI